MTSLFRDCGSEKSKRVEDKMDYNTIDSAKNLLLIDLAVAGGFVIGAGSILYSMKKLYNRDNKDYSNESNIPQEGKLEEEARD